ncbi:polysaccharide deacetylase [Thermolongibacillus altinsuensis]|uniref:Polysaccharide deacetylase n=1 Tax=Thermolongibacillus altinsuensis TaxID=575256 RepID=A0A4R1QRX1_9BACL|nr:polysaccharide deacetylase family protein [Thermolongibacillus altinsuensis]TCL52800.1 polysaccharide deacetylase [Thermolongibacillus altinsuensis]
MIKMRGVCLIIVPFFLFLFWRIEHVPVYAEQINDHSLHRLFRPLAYETISGLDNSAFVPVLMYHHFSKNVKASTVVHPYRFYEQMKALKENGYETITERDLIGFMKGKKRLPKKPVLITIDDGYYSNYQYAFPILASLKMKATIYLVVGDILDKRKNDHPLPRLTWAEVKAMYRSGFIDFQSHTFAMHRKGVTKKGLIAAPIWMNGKMETKEQYERRVLNDLLRSKAVIEQKLGNKVISFCYPFGSFSKHSEQLVKKAGFQLSLTTKPGANAIGDGPFLLKRINVDNTDTGDKLIRKIEKYKRLERMRHSIFYSFRKGV